MKKPSVLPLMLASGLGAMSYGTIFTIVDDLRDRYGISEARLGLIMGVGFFAGFVSNVFLAPYADRGHAKRMIMIGIIVQLLGNTMFGFLHSFWPLFLARAIMGIGGGMIYPAVRRIVIIRDPDNMGSNLGRMLSVDVGGFTFGPMLSAVTVGTFGIASPFVIISVLMVVMGLRIMRIEVSEANTDDAPRQRLAFDLFRSRAFSGTITIGAALFVLIGTFDALWSLMMKDMDAPSWVANVGISLFAMPMLFLGPMGGRFTQNVGPFKASIGGLTAGAFILTMYGVLPSPYPMLVFGVMHGIIDGLTVTGGSTAIAMIVPKSRIASAQGMQGATQTVIAGVASVVAGSAYGAYGRTTTFVSAAVIMLTCIAVGSWMVREHIHMKGSDVLDPGSTGAVEPLL